MTDESISGESYASSGEASTAPPAVVVLGAGRAGTAIAREIAASEARLVGVWNRSPRHRPDRLGDAAYECGGGAPSDALLQAADVVLLAVLDSAIEEVAGTLSFRPGSCVLHVSGSRDADVLRGLPPGVHGGGYHPLQSFAPATAPAFPIPPYCVAIEGDDLAIEAARRLAHATGHPSVQIAPGGKAAYHAAAVLASNCLVALQSVATRVMGLAGAEDADRWRLLWPLVAGTLANLEAGRFAEVITGPVPRGDADTVRRNLDALAADPAAAELYRALGRATLDLVEDTLAPGRAEAVQRAFFPDRTPKS